MPNPLSDVTAPAKSKELTSTKVEPKVESKSKSDSRLRVPLVELLNDRMLNTTNPHTQRAISKAIERLKAK